MGEASGPTAALRATLEALSAALGPSYTAEEASVTVRLSHDRGMRLRTLLLAECGADASEEYRRQLTGGPTPHQDQHLYVLTFSGIRLEWPARAIAVGPGRQMYI